MSCQTQWRFVGEPPCHAGLDYVAAGAVMDMMGIKRKRRPGLLARIKIIEAEALKVKQQIYRREIERQRASAAARSGRPSAYPRRGRR